MRAAHWISMTKMSLLPGCNFTSGEKFSGCPGKCLHALASLLCEEVREDIQCPAQSMRCCVDRGNKPKPGSGGPPNDLDASASSRPETSTKRVQRPLPPRTTTSATTQTTKTITTTRRTQPAVASDKCLNLLGRSNDLYGKV